MKRLLPLILLCGWAASLPLFAQPDLTPWNIRSANDDGTVEFDIESGEVVARNGVIVTYQAKDGRQAELQADNINLNQQTGEVMAQGNVFLRGEGQSWVGERIQYNFKTKDISTGSFRTGYAPIYAGGLNLQASVSNNVYTATNAMVTIDDLAKPYYRVEAKELILVPGEYVKAKRAKIYLGKTPIFYLPSYYLSLKQHERFWVTDPGYRSLWGTYLMTEYNWLVSDNLHTAMHFDYRSRRGVGIGPDISLDLGRYGRTEVRGYYTRDDSPHLNAGGRQMDKNRHRIHFTYEVDVRTNFTVKAVVREQSDPFILRDFFEWEYQENTQPNSFLEAEYLWRNFSLNALVSPRINDFFERVERLPDVQFTGLRQQLGNTPLFYESQSSAGYLKHEFIDNSTPSFAATRIDTYHQVLLPKTYMGWLNITPRVGQRYTYYGETEGGFAGPEMNRWVFNTGMEASFKLSRTWLDLELPWFKSTGLRHIMEPSLNYVFVPSPNMTPSELPQFDSIIPTLRLLPLDYPDFNAIDSVDSENTLRFGLRNLFQTKREEQTDTLLAWNLFTDWRLRTRPDQDTFSDAFSDIDFKPRDWLTLTSETRYDIDQGQFNLADHRVVVSPGDRWSLSIGHRYLRTVPGLGVGNNLILGSWYYRLNENWGFNTRQVFEARNGTAQEQSYSIYRDFRSWVGSLVFRLRDFQGGTDDFTVAATFSAKAFPRIRQGEDRDHPNYLISGR